MIVMNWNWTSREIVVTFYLVFALFIYLIYDPLSNSLN